VISYPRTTKMGRQTFRLRLRNIIPTGAWKFYSRCTFKETKAVQFLTISLFHRSVYGKISSTPPQLIHIYRQKVVWQMITLKDRICGVMGYFSTKGKSSFQTINPYALVYYTRCMTLKQEAILASYAHSKIGPTILLAGDVSISWRLY